MHTSFIIRVQDILDFHSSVREQALSIKKSDSQHKSHKILFRPNVLLALALIIFLSIIYATVITTVYCPTALWNGHTSLSLISCVTLSGAL